MSTKLKIRLIYHLSNIVDFVDNIVDMRISQNFGGFNNQRIVYYCIIS